MMRHIEYMRQKSKEAQANMQSDNLDMVNSPAHYNKSGIETIDIIESVTFGVEDLEKARWYLNRLIRTIGENKDDI